MLAAFDPTEHRPDEAFDRRKSATKITTAAEPNHIQMAPKGDPKRHSRTSQLDPKGLLGEVSGVSGSIVGNKVLPTMLDRVGPQFDLKLLRFP